MLKSLDILIGLIVILLALSMAVTLVTQVISTAVNRRAVTFVAASLTCSRNWSRS